MFRTGLIIAAAGVVAVLLLAWLTGLELSVFVLLNAILYLAGVLLFLAVATWVVANVWKSVMRR